MTLARFFDILIQRFVTDQMAAVYCPDCGEPHPICSMELVEPGEMFDCEVSVSGFNLFGVLLFHRIVGAPIPFVNPHRSDNEPG